MATQNRPTPRSRWSFTVARLFGIDLRLHATFFLLLTWVAFANWATGDGGLAVVRGLLITLSVFAVVVIHELGHALTARRYGVKTDNITLYPIGGVARLEKFPENPRQELLIAVAGPSTNLVMALALGAWVFLTGQTLSFVVPGTPGAPYSLQLFWINVILGSFNLLPAFPMDGGRIFRAILSMRTSRVKATAWAASVGQGFALLLGALGLFFNPWLILLAFFVWIGGQEELKALQLQTALQRFTTREAMVTHIETLSPYETLANVADRVLRGFQQDFPVVEDDRVVGLLSFRDLLFGLSRSGGNARVQAFMQRDFESADPDEPLNALLERAEKNAPRTVVVQQQGHVLGVVDANNVRELLRIESALVTHG